jgi:hypothetical protein
MRVVCVFGKHESHLRFWEGGTWPNIFKDVWTISGSLA